MKLSLTLFLAMALSMSPFAGRGPGCPSYLSWVCNWDQKVDLPEEQHPMETKSQTSTLHCWFGLTSCPVRIEDTKNKRSFLRSRPCSRPKARPPDGTPGLA